MMMDTPFSIGCRKRRQEFSTSSQLGKRYRAVRINYKKKKERIKELRKFKENQEM